MQALQAGGRWSKAFMGSASRPDGPRSRACLAGRPFSSHGGISALGHLRVGDFAGAWERRVGQGSSVDRVRSAPQVISNAVSSLECSRMATSITRGGFSTGRLCGILTPRNRRVPRAARAGSERE